MRHPLPRHDARERLVSYFWSGDAIRSRSVASTVLTGTVELPAPPARLLADWQRETSVRLGLEPGDVEVLSLARARARWPDYRRCVEALSGWTRRYDLYALLGSCEAALMACRGARYHHDAEHYGGAAFCNLFVSEDKGQDVYFPGTGDRIPLARGTVVVFDTGQPHAVIDRRSPAFRAADFPADQDCTQLFLTWELPIEDARVANALGVTWDVDPSTASLLRDEQVWLNGARAHVCQDSGRWLPAV
jgi:hypothetical protein